MEEVLIQNARAYAAQHRLQLAERLGFGIHGIILVAGDNSKGGKTAVKAHRAAEPYLRERTRMNDCGKRGSRSCWASRCRSSFARTTVCSSSR